MNTHNYEMSYVPSTGYMKQPPEDLPAEVMHPTMTDFVVSRVCETNISDYIKLTRAEDVEIMNLWEQKIKEKELRIPADLFFANTIPLMDCFISIDERDPEVKESTIIEYRVTVFEDYAEKLALSNGKWTIVGAITSFCGKDIFMVFPIMVRHGYDYLNSVGVGLLNAPISLCREFKAQNTQLMVGMMFAKLLETWYGIQIALLHPEVKEVFANPINCKFGKQNEKKLIPTLNRKTKYVRKHIVNADVLKKKMYGENQHHNMKCLAWYVVGHWRHYKNGKTVFIKPYWKGKLRNLKMNFDERERVVV